MECSSIAVNITPNKTFEIVPVLGNQIIKLGNADSLQSKFDRLTAFYKQVWAKEGFEKYESINVEFSGQIVTVKRGAQKPSIDTAEAQRLINAMRKGEDIVKDTSVTVTTVTTPPALQVRINQMDSFTLTKTKTLVLNKNIKLNNIIRQTKLPSAAKRTVRVTKKAVIKSRRKGLG